MADGFERQDHLQACSVGEARWQGGEVTGLQARSHWS